MSYMQQKESYDKHGFVVIPGLLRGDEVAELQQNLDRYVRDVVPYLPDTDAFYHVRERPETLKQLHRMDCDPYFSDYAKHPKWTALGEALIGETGGAQSMEWFNKPPGTNHITPPHQDNYYFCLAPASVVTIWLALDPVDAENGCLRYVSGSHLSGFRDHEKSKVLGFSQGITGYSADDFVREVAVPLQPGDAVAHHGMIIHRADANSSQTRQRRSLAMVFRGISCHRDEMMFARYQATAREQLEEMNEESVSGPILYPEP